jgi:hypothetical protein
MSDKEATDIIKQAFQTDGYNFMVHNAITISADLRNSIALTYILFKYFMRNELLKYDKLTMQRLHKLKMIIIRNHMAEPNLRVIAKLLMRYYPPDEADYSDLY